MDLRTRKQIAEYTGISYEMTRRRIVEMKLPMTRRGGEKLFDLDAFMQNVVIPKSNRKPKPSSSQPSPPETQLIPKPLPLWSTASSVPIPPAPLDESDPYVKILLSGQATALEISRAAVQIASREVGRALTSGTNSGRALDDLKKLLQELRQGEADFIELGKVRRELIEIAEVERVIGMLAGRLVKCVGVLENTIATEFAIWRTEPTMADLSPESWAMKVREFVRKVCNEVRTADADETQRLLAEVSSEAESGGEK